MAVSDYKTDPNENTTISGINIAEGCAPSGINNAIRQLMADVKADKTAQDTATAERVKTVNNNAPDSNGNITPAQTGCLPLTGGTMTGSINSDNIDQINITNTNVGIGDTSRPSSMFNKPITVFDKDGKRGGAVEVSWNSDGSRSICFSIRNRNDSGYPNAGVFESKEGYISFACNGSQALLPAGAVFAFAANSAPSGCLLCNGAAVSRTIYAALFEAIGTTYGGGDGSTTFNLPNLTDKFIQGSGTAGTVKGAGLPEIRGNFYTGGLMTVGDGAFGTWNFSGDGLRLDYSGSFKTGKSHDFYASRCSSVYGASTTVQPPALTMRYYIKY